MSYKTKTLSGLIQLHVSENNIMLTCYPVRYRDNIPYFWHIVSEHAVSRSLSNDAVFIVLLFNSYPVTRVAVNGIIESFDSDNFSSDCDGFGHDKTL